MRGASHIQMEIMFLVSSSSSCEFSPLSNLHASGWVPCGHLQFHCLLLPLFSYFKCWRHFLRDGFLCFLPPQPHPACTLKWSHIPVSFHLASLVKHAIDLSCVSPIHFCFSSRFATIYYYKVLPAYCGKIRKYCHFTKSKNSMHEFCNI